jgi:5-methylcytosine-specific restriction endonuclease McrA
MGKENEQYGKLLQSVGVETFVKYYDVFKANRLVRSNEAIKDAFRKGGEEWVDNASNTKAHCGKKIFELGQEIYALLHVVEARVSDNIKEMARDYLLKELAQQEFVISEESLKKANYKEHYISNAQNSLVRYILGNLRDASFTKDDWTKSKKESFSGKCVYCGKKGNSIDHAIPINRDKLGEHLLGNLVPSCKACNASKSGKDYREFLTLLKEKADDPDEKLLFEQRIDFIEKYMTDSHYVPLSKHPQRDAIKKKLEDAYDEVAALADKYAKEISNLINS